jgi:hypothetical protein
MVARKPKTPDDRRRDAVLHDSLPFALIRRSRAEIVEEAIEGLKKDIGKIKLTLNA